MRIDPNRLGVVAGALFGAWHLVWVMLVASNLAQPLVENLLHYHFLDVAVRIAPFDISRAVALVVVSSIVGYVLGAFAAALWNGYLQPKKSDR